MKVAFIGVLRGGTDDTGLLTFETAPAVKGITTQAVQNKQAK